MRDLAEHSVGRISWIGCAVANTAYNDPEAWSAMGEYMPVWGYGRTATQHVCKGADVLIAWGIRDLPQLVDGFKGKVVLVTHGADMAWTRAVVMGSAGAATHYAAVSKACRRSFSGVVPWDNVRVVENGINARRCVPLESRIAVRRRLGIRDGEFVVGYCGRYSGEKRPTVIADAVALLPDRFRGIWIGDGHQREPMQKHIRERIGDRAIFVPRVDDVGTYYRAMDCCILASETEGFSLTSLEAMHCGTPLIATPVGAMPELEEKFGLRWWPVSLHVDAKELASQIAVLDRTDAKALSSRTAAAKAMVNENYLAGHMADRWVAYLEEIVGMSDTMSAQEQIRALELFAENGEKEAIYGASWNLPESDVFLGGIKRDWFDVEVRQGRTVLEIGSGGGRWSRFLKGACKEAVLVDGTDASRRVIEARWPWEGYRYMVSPDGSLPDVESGSVDYCWSFDTFVHFHKELFDHYVAEVGRVLRPGGVFHLHFAKRFPETQDGAPCFQYRSLEEVRGLLVRSGMSITREMPIVVGYGSYLIEGVRGGVETQGNYPFRHENGSNLVKATETVTSTGKAGS